VALHRVLTFLARLFCGEPKPSKKQIYGFFSFAFKEITQGLKGKGF